MTALVYAPHPYQFFAFPLVIRWQARYDGLPVYFPDLHFGLLEGGPDEKGFTAVLSPPRSKQWDRLHREYQPGELEQWQAYLDFLATLEDRDEIDLKAAIRGRLEPILPQEVDRELLWSLAYQMEQMLAEKAEGLARLARQQEALTQALGADLQEEEELAPLNASWNPTLTGGPPDLALSRVRYQFWREVLAPHLQPPWAALVLEPAAGESSPRYLWQAGQEEGDGELWQAAFTLPVWQPQPGLSPADMELLQLGVEFRKTLAEVLRTLTERPGEAATAREQLSGLVEGRLWPAAASAPPAQSIRMEIYGWLKIPSNGSLVSEPMVFLAPAGS